MYEEPNRWAYYVDTGDGLWAKDCQCKNCRSEGAWEYVHGHPHPLCRFVDEYKARKAAENCKLCIEGMNR